MASERRVSRQAIGWLAGVVVLYLPAFIFWPNWVNRWLASPRPLALRAMAGLIPRGLALSAGQGWLFWFLWLVLSAGLLGWLLRRGNMSLDRWMLWYFIASPLIHDYDVIQLIPQIEDATTRKLAVILSIPLWLVILFFYSNDLAWIAVTLIAPGLLIYGMWKKKPERIVET